jgi:hypothetical protein
MAKRSPFGSHEKSVTVSMRVKKKIIAQRVRNHTFELDNFYGEVLLAYPEYLEVAKSRFLSLGMAVNPDTEKVAPILPI